VPQWANRSCRQALSGPLRVRGMPRDDGISFVSARIYLVRSQGPRRQKLLEET
jgi:hypothetical protein